MKTYTFVMIRHGESEWNKLNLFTGWTDVELSEKGVEEAKNGGKMLKEKGFYFDICYTSYLKRAIHTAYNVLAELDEEYIPMIKDYRLNERHYGALQGLNKAQAALEHGEAQVKIWRRSFDVRPPLLSEDDPRNPRLQKQYAGIDPKNLPLAESLKDTIARAVPYFNEVIAKDILAGKSVLIAAHGNSLRSLVMYLDKLSEEEIIEVNIPTGVPLVYTVDENMNVIEKHYLMDEKALKEKMEAVANQGKAK